MFSYEYCQISRNTYFEDISAYGYFWADFRKWLYRILFQSICFQSHPDLVIMQKYQSHSNQSFKYNSVDMLPLESLADTTSSDHVIFLCLSEVWSMLHHGSVGWVQNKSTTLCFHLLFWHFSVVSHHNICVFIIFIPCFWLSIKFPQEKIPRNWCSNIVSRTAFNHYVFFWT